MAQSNVPVTAGSGKNIDAFTTATQGNFRQAVVVADPSTDANTAAVTAANALKVDNSAVTQPVSGTITGNQGTPNTLANRWPVQVSDGTNTMPTGDAAARSIHVTADNTSLPVSESGVWTVQPGNTPNTTPWLTTQTPSASGGLSIFRLLSAATTNGNNIKASAGQIYGWYITNSNASARFVKLYNKATAPTVGTDTPVITLLIPGNANGAGANVDFVEGLSFATGIGIGITGAVTDADTTAVAANEVVVNIFYK